MAAKPGKPRPNEMATDLSDAQSYGVRDAQRTQGWRRSATSRRSTVATWERELRQREGIARG